MWENFPEIRRELTHVQGVITAEVKRPGGKISEGLLDLVHRDAKLLRPAFTILAARIQSGGKKAEEKIIRLAAAIEMLHVASLIHDDIADGAEKRRGGEALHRRYGDRTAVLMGDYLFARCFSLVSEYAQPENAAMLSATVGRLIESEVSEFVDDDAWSPRQYLHRVIGKTAVLFSLSFHVGAAEGIGENGDPRSIEILRRIGYNVGIGFQIIDDVLDLFGDMRTMGKPIGGDLKRGIVTLPIILAANNGQRPRLVRTIEKIASRSSRRGHTATPGVIRFFENRAIQDVRAKIEEAGGKQGALAAAEIYTRRAHRELDRLPDSPDSRVLREVTTSLLSRTA